MVSSWSQVRDRFPALDGIVHLNTCGGGPISVDAANAAKRYYDEMLTSSDTLWETWLERVETARGALARFLNTNPEQIAFLPNASQGLNFATRLFDGSGAVVAPADEFPSVTLPWLLHGREVRNLASAADGSIDADQIDVALTPDVDVLAMSHVQFATGYRADLDSLGRICRDRDICFVVDATQSLGVVRIDLECTPVDFLVFSGYKWAAAGYGVAGLYLRKELLKQSGLPAVGWRSAREPYDLINDRLDLATDARALELGHPLFPGIFALGAAIELISEMGIDRIETRVCELTDLLHAEVDARRIEIVSPRPPRQRAGITVLRVPDPTVIAERLAESDVCVSARCGGLRVGIHFYNDESDIQGLLSTLDAFL